jgi:hypothetical protein
LWEGKRKAGKHEWGQQVRLVRVGRGGGHGQGGRGKETERRRIRIREREGGTDARREGEG